MGEIFEAAPGVHESVAGVSQAAGDAHVSAGSADHGAHVAAVGAALGPFGAPFLAAYAPAQGNCLLSTQQVGQVFHGLCAATLAHKAAIVAVDNA
jgi:hypothetical protein